MEYFGIDVSKWQGDINWTQVKSTDKSFAIIKVTGKSNSVEEYFERNYQGASSANLNIGVYKYVYAMNEEEAIAEANGVINALNGKSINCGIWLDMEDAETIGTLTKDQLTTIINVEANTLIDAGFKVGIYCNKNWYDNKLDSATLRTNYPFWIARYPSNDTGTYNPSSTLSPKKYAVAWQYSSKGTVDGITGNVDLDVAYQDLTELMKPDGGETKVCPYKEPTKKVCAPFIAKEIGKELGNWTSFGNDAKWVQWNLKNKANYQEIEVTGVIGIKTDSYIKVFQAANELESNGVVDEDTRDKLKNL